MELEFGDGTDNDTFDNIFGRIAEGHYVVEVNGVDLQLFSTYTPGGESGLAGLRWNDEAGEADHSDPRWFRWEDIEKVVIY